MKSFFSKLLSFLFLFLITLIGFKLVIPHNYSDDVILNYQKKKILINKKVTAAFFGDSSCGNAIDSKVFGDSVSNFSLVGDYAYRGSFEMIKLVKKNHPELKTVYIMHTLDVLNRETNMYKLINSEPDVFEILTKEMYVFLTRILNRSFDGLFKNKIVIENDYLKQNAQTNIIIPKILKSPISPSNRESIKEMVKYFNEQKMEYVFLIGPSTDILKNQIYDDAISFFEVNHFKLVKENYHLSIKNIGDGNDHVSPDFKKESSRFYLNEINKILSN